MAVDVGKRFTARRTVDDLALVVGEGVVDRHDLVRCNDHKIDSGFLNEWKKTKAGSDGLRVLELEPAAGDAINDPDADDEDTDRKRDETDEHEEQRQRQQEHDRDPQRSEPERAQLPGEMR